MIYTFITNSINGEITVLGLITTLIEILIPANITNAKVGLLPFHT